jgi:hypothetical protein
MPTCELGGRRDGHRTGATPVVDTQTSTKREVVLSNEVLAAIPATRTYGNILAMVPGVQSLTLDVNSTQSLTGTATNFFFTSRGGRGNEGHGPGRRHERRVGVRRRRRLELRLRFRERAGGPGDRRGRDGRERPRRAGIQHHSQDRRQSFSGTAFGSTAGKWSQGNNLDDDLRRVGITSRRDSSRTGTRTSPSAVRSSATGCGSSTTCAATGRTRTFPVSTPTPTPSMPRSGLREGSERQGAVGGAKKIEAHPPDRPGHAEKQGGFYWEYQANCTGSALVNTAIAAATAATTGSRSARRPPSPESANMWPEREKITQATWTSPATNRLLFEAGFSRSAASGADTFRRVATGLVAVTEQSTAAGVPSRTSRIAAGRRPRPTISSTTSGARRSLRHRRAQLQGRSPAAYEVYRQIQNVDNQLAYTFNNGAPLQFTMRIGPHIQSNRTRYDGFYAQDQWTQRPSHAAGCACDTSTRGAGSRGRERHHR